MDYETDTLSRVSGSCPINFHLIEDLAWTEIDDENHFIRAKDKIYPEIKKRELLLEV